MYHTSVHVDEYLYIRNVFQVNMLRKRNESYGTIKFVDISSDDYSPDENQGLDYKTVSL